MNLKSEHTYAKKNAGRMRRKPNFKLNYEWNESYVYYIVIIMFKTKISKYKFAFK